MSWTKASPNLTCTFSVMFWTGRMSLLYPRKRSRTSRSSSSEHRPANQVCQLINLNFPAIHNFSHFQPATLTLLCRMDAKVHMWNIMQNYASSLCGERDTCGLVERQAAGWRKEIWRVSEHKIMKDEGLNALKKVSPSSIMVSTGYSMASSSASEQYAVQDMKCWRLVLLDSRILASCVFLLILCSGFSIPARGSVVLKRGFVCVEMCDVCGWL